MRQRARRGAHSVGLPRPSGRPSMVIPTPEAQRKRTYRAMALKTAVKKNAVEAGTGSEMEEEAENRSIHGRPPYYIFCYGGLFWPRRSRDGWPPEIHHVSYHLKQAAFMAFEFVVGLRTSLSSTQLQKKLFKLNLTRIIIVLPYTCKHPPTACYGFGPSPNFAVPHVSFSLHASPAVWIVTLEH